MTLLDEATCHGRVTFTGRPPAGTGTWAWWWSTWAGRALLYYGEPGGGAEPDLWGLTRWTGQGPVVMLHWQLTPQQRELALAHEMHHLAIGGVCRRRCPRSEAKVVRATSRWLIPDVAELAERLKRGSLGRAARDYGLPSSTLTERLTYTTPSERRVVDEIMRGAPRWLPEARAALPALSEAS